MEQYPTEQPVPKKRVERRNTRERSRIGVINTTFQQLRQFFPPKKAGRRMSKLEILQRAINYIRDLSHSLESGEITSPRKLASIPIPKRTRSRKSRLNKELFPKSEDSEDYASKNSHSPNAGTPTEQLWYEPPPAMAHTPYNPACYYSSGATLPSCHASFNQNIFSPTESHSDSSIYSFNSSSSAPNDDDFVIDDNLLAELTSIISSQQTTVADPPFPFSF